MDKVVIEIDGVRHRLYNKDVVCCGCQVCSLRELCIDALRTSDGFCSPFLEGKLFGHFELVDK